VVEALHTQGRPAPWEYVELMLCRDIYHCTPGELDKQDPIKVLRHLEALSGEAVVRKLRRKS
jgi:hypothetical protein